MPPLQQNSGVKPIYLDCASTTPPHPQVVEKMLRHFSVDFGNAGSRGHSFGASARQAVEAARLHVARVVDAGRAEVIFTSGATESNNLAILGLAEHGRKSGRRHIVSTAIEHRAVLEPIEALGREGFEITFVGARPTGAVDAAQMRAAVRPDTLLVTMMQINNETGVRQPVAELAALLADQQALFHVDAAQGFGREIGTLRHPRIDLISISGHKIHGPQGVGALVTRRRDGARPPLSPLFYGGGQEFGLRPGTAPLALIAGFGEAARLALLESDARNARCREFGDRLLAGLQPLQPLINGDRSLAAPHILNLSFPGVAAEEAIEALSHLIAISDGAACTSNSTTCSHVLSSMGLGSERTESALRFSWSHDTEEPDWAQVVKVMRELSRRR